jgi:hypothetical protein
MGPRSGRAAGFCAGFGLPGYANPIPGRGFGLGCGGGAGRGGGGRGWRNRFYATGLPGWARAEAPVGWVPYSATPGPEQEVAVLKQQVERLDSVRESIRQRLREIEAEPAAK